MNGGERLGDDERRAHAGGAFEHRLPRDVGVDGDAGGAAELDGPEVADPVEARVETDRDAVACAYAVQVERRGVVEELSVGQLAVAIGVGDGIRVCNGPLSKKLCKCGSSHREVAYGNNELQFTDFSLDRGRRPA